MDRNGVPNQNEAVVKYHKDQIEYHKGRMKHHESMMEYHKLETDYHERAIGYNISDDASALRFFIGIPIIVGVVTIIVYVGKHFYARIFRWNCERRRFWELHNRASVKIAFYMKLFDDLSEDQDQREKYQYLRSNLRLAKRALNELSYIANQAWKITNYGNLMHRLDGGIVVQEEVSHQFMLRSLKDSVWGVLEEAEYYYRKEMRRLKSLSESSFLIHRCYGSHYTIGRMWVYFLSIK